MALKWYYVDLRSFDNDKMEEIYDKMDYLACMAPSPHYDKTFDMFIDEESRYADCPHEYLKIPKELIHRIA